MSSNHIPELLAPAGTLDAVRAAVANGANAVYLGASMYNARDEGAQLSLEELAQACAIAHARNVRVYLTFNVLIKPAELHEALRYLGECIDRGIDAAIVQDLGVVRLIQQVYPDLEIHGSTQLTVHDARGALVMHRLGIERVVLARENTLDDIRSIRDAVPELGLETFVHGALCISYSGQCFMSGMISERSANRGSCAQSCRKDYTLTDNLTNATLDSGYLISAKDLAAHDHLEDLARLGVGCLKVEGRKKKPEYVATVTKAYRGWIDAIGRGEHGQAPSLDAIEPLVQIFSRGNTGGMYGGRQGREYITRTQPDNRGLPLGAVVSVDGADITVDTSHALAVGDGLGFEPPHEGSSATTGGTVQTVRSAAERAGRFRQVITVRWPSPPARGTIVQRGWRVVRTYDVTLLRDAQASFADVPMPERVGLTRVDVRVFGHAGGPLKTHWQSGTFDVTIRGDVPLAKATKRALDMTQLREQLGRLGETPFKLGSVDMSALGPDLFLPVSELNRIRQEATERLLEQREWEVLGTTAVRESRIDAVVRTVAITTQPTRSAVSDPARATDQGRSTPALRAIVYDLDDARAAAAGGATEIILDPFLRHPAPPLARIATLREELQRAHIGFRLRTPSVVRPEEQRRIQKWMDLAVPLLSGHLGIIAEAGAQHRDVIADYATNVFNQHTAALLFELGASRLVVSIELTVGEIGELVAPWDGDGFDVLIYGRPEGMTIEHCVLSAAFDREPATCRDLCVQKHPNVSLTDPAGYTFAVATDSACRNRLLHSRPIEASEYLPALWAHGVRGYQLVFNVAGDPVEAIVRSYRTALDALAEHVTPDSKAVRSLLDGAFTRGHFARAV